VIDESSPRPDREHDEVTARLLWLGGQRADVPEDCERRVKRAVLDEVRAVARGRRRRRAAVVAGIGLSMAAAALLMVRMASSRIEKSPLRAEIATVERLEGDGGGVIVQDGSTAPVRLALAGIIRADDRIATGLFGRVGLRLSDNVSLRFDRASRARLVSASRIDLEAGAIYVDSGHDTPPLEVHTSFGVVRDIGTQFEVRVGAEALRVRVRSGVVEVRHGDVMSPARPGTELTLDRRGASTRAVLPYGSEWTWAAELGRPLTIEGLSLKSFVDHLCREQGWTAAYGDATLARDASGIILHGSADGLQPTESLAVVLATTGLTYRLKDGELLITRPVER
jgi:ferric-dicitrate binding protein FerR (iron transport regulator)